MAGVRIDREIRISLRGEAPAGVRCRLKEMLLEEIDNLVTPLRIDTALIAYLPGKTSIEALLAKAPAAMKQAADLIGRFKSGERPIRHGWSCPNHRRDRAPTSAPVSTACCRPGRHAGGRKRRLGTQPER